MSAVSRTPAEKDSRKMMMEIPTIIPALRQLVVVASLGSVEIGSVGIENHKGCHNIMYNNYDYPHSIYTHSIPIHPMSCYFILHVLLHILLSSYSHSSVHCTLILFMNFNQLNHTPWWGRVTTHSNSHAVWVMQLSLLCPTHHHREGDLGSSIA